ncbi:MATE family efflux transporter [Acholeplasma granularum]|uniref:MATE family efflux transporter n=1 Tax=Acholeplasma granularum TaxID=264635 RepID=UPI00046F89AA|nr:MATE family efflux transporter [Acholeplasma granularum]
MQLLNKQDEARRRQITTGNLWKTILILSIPLAIYETFNYLYAFIDLWLISGINTNFVTSVIFIDELRLAVTAFGGSIAAAGSVIVAKHFGSNDIDLAKRSAAQAILLAVIVSFGIVLVMVSFGTIILQFFGATPEIIDSGLSYYNIQMITTGLVAFNSVFIGIEKAKGNTKIILYANIIVMAIKLILSAVWVKVFGGGLFELSLSSMLAQLMLTFIGVYILLFYKKNSLKLNLSSFKIENSFMKEIFILAIPVFLGKFLFNMGKVFINGIALMYHYYVVAALGISGKIFGFFASVANVFHETEMAVISQNIGYRRLDRAIKSFYIAITYAAVVSVVGLIISWFIKDSMLNLLGNFDSEQRYVILEIYNYEQFSLVFSALISAISGLFIGFKKTKVVFWINIIRVVFLRLPVLWLMYTFLPGKNFRDVGFVMFFSNSLTTIIAGIIAIRFIYTLKTYGYQDLNYLKIE